MLPLEPFEKPMGMPGPRPKCAPRPLVPQGFATELEASRRYYAGISCVPPEFRRAHYDGAFTINELRGSESVPETPKKTYTLKPRIDWLRLAAWGTAGITAAATIAAVAGL